MKALLILAMLFPAIAVAEPVYLECVADDYTFAMTVDEATGKVAVSDNKRASAGNGAFTVNEIVYFAGSSNRDYHELRTYIINRVNLSVTYEFRVTQFRTGYVGNSASAGTCMVVQPPTRKI